MALDIGLAEIKDDSWWSLFKREYVANLVTSPLWLVVAVLWNMADVKENGEWKRHKEQILGHIKGKETVEVIHLREIIQNKYDQDKELEAMQEQRVRMAAPVNEAELRL